MDMKVDGLIEKIRQEGVEEARVRSDEVVAEARQKAEKIVAGAHQEAKEVLETARKQAEELRQNAEADLRRVSRDIQLHLKHNIETLLAQCLQKEVAEAMQPALLSDLILKTFDRWVQDAQMEISVSEKDLESLESLVFARLKSEQKDGVTLRAHPDISRGFRLGLHDGEEVYDVTEEAVAETFQAALTPRLRALLNG